MVLNREPQTGGRPPSPPIFNAPRVILVLCGTILVIHILRFLLPVSLDREVFFYGSVIPARYWGDHSVSLVEMIAPLVSYNFLHADLMHVGFNAIWLLALGTPVARRLSLGRFLGLSLLCGVLGALVHIVIYRASLGALIGASGAIAGLMGAAARFALFVPGGYALAFRHGFNGGLILPINDRRVLGFSAVWIGINLVFGLLGGLFLGGAGQSIAWDVHIVGYLSGLILFPRFDRLQRGPAPRDRSHLRRVK
ncbi:MAG: rhomboid family intramembrane serine protease [Alphaproteobacteria bacterium]|nr:MAG: rhomboid family intramembrane serine protease [Alphaproteobacteria bacterium]